MGLFGGKKNEAGKAGAGAGSARKPVTEAAPNSSRKSVRRVVAASKGPAAAKPASQPPRPTQPAAKASAVEPAEPPVVDEVQLAPPEPEVDQLDLGSGPHPIAAEPPPLAGRGGGKQPILASSAPDFAGSLGAARPSGPSRTGDQVLLDFLTGKGALISAEQASAAKAKADQDGLPLDEAAVRLGMLTEEQLVNSLSQETWVPHLKVDKYEIRKKALDTVTKDDAQHFGVFPVDKLGNLLTLAMVNPLDVEAIRQLEGKTGLDIKKVVATRSEIAGAIDKYYGGKVVAAEGSRSFSQDTSDKPAKSPTQMLQRPEPAAALPAAITPARPAAVTNIAPDISADIQDIDDLLGGEETIAPAIIEPVSIKPEESNDALELTDAPITQSHHKEPEFAAQDQPRASTGALARQEPDLEKTDAIAPPAAHPRPAAAARPGRSELRSATARVTAGGAAGKVVNLIPVMEEEFRYAISHGKSRIFERWVALQTRNRIVNGVSVDKELDGVLAGLYATPRKAG